MHLLIDYREKNAMQKLIDSLTSNPSITILQNSFTITNLHLGDFQFIDDVSTGSLHEPTPPIAQNPEVNMHMIIERKTVNDLAASIKDGRYMEQKMRLLSKRDENPNLKIAYIIEGDYSFSPGFTCANMNNKSLSGVIINSIIRDNIIVWSTKNISETNDLILNLHTRFSTEPKKYFGMREHEDENKKTDDFYTSTVIAGKLHSVKKDNLNVKMCLQIQLSCIPGVSTKKAQSIIEDLGIKSMYHLGCILKKESEMNESLDKKSKKNVLQSVSGIGSKLENTIRDFVLGDG